MNPIEIKMHGSTRKSSREMCSTFLDLDHWSEFTGYSILPGIKSASFEIQTPNVVGSRVKVQNTDGSSHVEEIIEWDVDHGMAIKFQEFDSALKNFATHFIETWTFRATNHGTEVTRAMTMYPKNVIGWIILNPISRLMKKAFEKSAEQLGDA